MLEAAEILSSAKLRDVEAAHCPGVATARALDPKGRFEADEIGGRADMLRGHFRRVTRREQSRNSPACGNRAKGQARVQEPRKARGHLHFDPEIADRTFKFRVPQQELTGSEVAGFLVKQRDLRPSHAVGAVGGRIQANERNPLVDEPRVLSRAEVGSCLHPAWKQPVLCCEPLRLDPLGERSSSLFGHFELNGPTRFPLKNDDPTLHTVGREYIADLQRDEVAAAQLAVQSQVEQREITSLACNLEPYAYAPHVNWLEGQLCACRLPAGVVADKRDCEHVKPPAIAGWLRVDAA